MESAPLSKQYSVIMTPFLCNSYTFPGLLVASVFIFFDNSSNTLHNLSIFNSDNLSVPCLSCPHPSPSPQMYTHQTFLWSLLQSVLVRGGSAQSRCPEITPASWEFLLPLSVSGTPDLPLSWFTLSFWWDTFSRSFLRSDAWELNYTDILNMENHFMLLLINNQRGNDFKILSENKCS